MISVSVGKYCCEDYKNIENYEEAVNSPETWICHHRQETHNPDGTRRSVSLSVEDLISWDLYYNRPADELIFLTRVEHRRVHGNPEVKVKERRLSSKDGRVVTAVYHIYRSVGGTMSWKEWRKQRNI